MSGGAQVPDAPGWWWRNIRGRAEVVRVWRSPIVDGRLDTTGDTPVGDVSDWLGPVAPPDLLATVQHLQRERHSLAAGCCPSCGGSGVGADECCGPDHYQPPCPDCGGTGASEAVRTAVAHVTSEVARLRAELAKPVAEPWVRFGGEYSCRLAAVRDGSVATECGRDGGEGPRVWIVRDPVTQQVIAYGPEIGEEGKRLADAAAAAAWRLL